MKRSKFWKVEVLKLTSVRVNVLKSVFCRQMSKAVGSSLLLQAGFSESLIRNEREKRVRKDFFFFFYIVSLCCS